MYQCSAKTSSDGRFFALSPFLLCPSFLQSHCSLNLSAGLASAAASTAFDDSQSLLSSEFGGAGFVPGGPDAEEKQSVSNLT